MKILAIETSCDDTCVSILKTELPFVEAKVKKRAKSSSSIENWKLEILSNIISSQVNLHAKYGGIYPFMAKREHQKNLPIVLKKALKESKPRTRTNSVRGKNQKIDLIAVTVGPGLEPCLWVGVNFAKDLSQSLNLPLVPVNHIEAHIFANFIKEQKTASSKQLFPAVCLVVSGGHTQLILMRHFGKYQILGETRDDAAGECFDKTARILGLGYPGGPAIAAEAAKFKISNLKTEFPFMEAKVKKRTKFSSPFKIKLPRPMIYQKNYDFSFSGLKTAVLYHSQNQPKKIKKSKKYIQAMAAEVQQAVIDVLIHKTLRAAKDYKVKTIILGGGVAANKELRKQFKKKIKKEIPNSLFLIPDSKFCTDNAAMVAAAAYFNWKKEEKTKPKNIEADANLRL
jgi:N6-L-threonylcarbamoyladenine synthase